MIVGSQSVHAATETVPAEVTISNACDILVDESDPAAAQIDAKLGRDSAIFDEHGVYLDIVPSTFPFLPAGWEDRVQMLEVGDLRARCLELHDLVLSKLAAGRLKDNELIASLIHHELVDVEITRSRILEVGDPEPPRDSARPAPDRDRERQLRLTAGQH